MGLAPPGVSPPCHRSLVTGGGAVGGAGWCGGDNPYCASRDPSKSKDREINMTEGAWGAPTSRGAHPGEEKTEVKKKLGHIPLIV